MKVEKEGDCAVTSLLAILLCVERTWSAVEG